MARTKNVAKRFIHSNAHKKTIAMKHAKKGSGPGVQKLALNSPQLMKRRRCRPGTVALREIRRFVIFEF
jgi:hypothetical protein